MEQSTKTIGGKAVGSVGKVLRYRIKCTILRGRNVEKLGRILYRVFVLKY